MTSKERMLAAINYERIDHVPLYCWTFGFRSPPHLRWQRHGRDLPYWYSMRLEHIHTLPQPWDVHDDFMRAQRWLSLGLDDVLDVSVPWAAHPDVRVRDWQEPPGPGRPYALIGREYQTPAGNLQHVVRKDEEPAAPGWVVQPKYVALFEDYNIPRGERHILADLEDLPKLRYLLGGPDAAQTEWYRDRIAAVRSFAQSHGLLTQAWSAFGMDGIVWLMGAEGAVLAAMQEPDFFAEAMTMMAEFDRKRTELALAVGSIDIIVQRGWYSSTDFWSPALFRHFILPPLKELVQMTHRAGVKFAYTMTTGLMAMMDLLAEAGIDLLYYVDPVQDRVDLVEARDKLAGRFALAGGVNSGVTLGAGKPDEVRRATKAAVEILGPSGFILSPVDALFPDTPWENVAAMIEAWRQTWQ
ncbi:MAG: uroporphyrinogen decarboxylase family protein [Anaerolineae bacterium]